MLKFLLVILCVYFFFRIIFRSFSANLRSATYDQTKEYTYKKQPTKSGKNDGITVEQVEESGPGAEYTDFEEIK